MSSNNSSNRRRNNEPEFYSRINKEELKVVKVAIKRKVPNPGPEPSAPLQRSLDNPADLVVHLHEGLRPIFDRDDIIVNKGDEAPEKRHIRTSPTAREEEDVKKTQKKKSNSRSRSRSISSNYRRRSRSVSPKRDGRGRSPYDKRGYNSNRYSREPGPSKRRSLTPLRPGEYRPTPQDRARYRSRSPRDLREKDYVQEKYRTKSRPRSRSRSPSNERYKPFPKRRSYSRSPPSSKHIPTTRKSNRSPERDRDKSARYLHDKNRSKSPPPRSVDKPYKEYPRRSPGPSVRRSRSPPHYDKSRSRRSKSGDRYKKNYPFRKTSPGRYEGESRHHSRSPTRRHEGYRGPPERRRSTSPSRQYKSRRSRSRSKYDRPYGRSSTEDKRRSRSPSSPGDRSHRPLPEHIMPDYTYYGGPEYWFPGPIRPEFVHRMYPPGFPRGMPVPPIIYPKAMVMPYPGPFPPRPRLPIYNNRSTKKIATATSTSTVSTEATMSTVTASSSNAGGTENVPSTSSSSAGGITIREMRESEEEEVRNEGSNQSCSGDGLVIKENSTSSDKLMD